MREYHNVQRALLALNGSEATFLDGAWYSDGAEGFYPDGDIREVISELEVWLEVHYPAGAP